MIAEIKVEANKDGAVGQFDIGPSSFTFLKNLFGSFERYRWHRLHIYYKPAVGTTAKGLVSYGADYTIKKVSQTRVQISSLTPNASHAVWADSTAKPLVIPSNMLQSRSWYTAEGDGVDKFTARLCWAVNADPGLIGELWVSYDVEMSGTRA